MTPQSQLAALDAAATQGELTIPARTWTTDRTSAYVTSDQPSIFVACAGREVEQREADTAFIVALWNLYRANKLVLVPSVEEVKAVFKRHHRDSCYPEASDSEADIFARAVLASMGAKTDGTRETVGTATP